jgi:DNA polymerase-3 subunit delta'
MNLLPKNQQNLYGLERIFNEFVDLYENKKLPTKILLSGQKGIGKSTLSYHLINYILSKDEEHSYDVHKHKINEQNHSFKLLLNGSNPNFFLIDVKPEKKFIEINQIRSLIEKLNKSSFNEKPKLVLIDNIEYLNINSINALLKQLEEPGEDIHFFLIKNGKKTLDTLNSRCLNYKISLSNKQVVEISNKLLKNDIHKLINIDLLNYYITPGKIYDLVQFSNENKIDLKNLELENFLNIIIDNSYYKNENSIKYMIFDFVELFLKKKISIQNYELFNYFLKKIENTYKFNLDEESFFLELKTKLING